MGLPRKVYLAKLLLMYGLLLVDLGINATADNNDTANAQTWYPYIFIGIQLLIQLLVFLLVFAALSGTYLFQVGLLGVLLHKFRWLLGAIPIYACMYMAYAAVKIATLVQHGQNQDELWQSSLFIFFSIAQKTSALIYYVVLIRAYTAIGQARWYQRGPWVSRFAARLGAGGRSALQ